MPEYFLIARIDSVEGEKGFLKITSFSDNPERFKNLQTVFIDFWEDKKIFTLESVKFPKNKILLKFKGFDDKDSVRLLIGKNIFVDDKNLIKLKSGHYFIHDIIGCKVMQNDSKYGTVVDVYSLKANDVFVIEKVNGEEILIPFIHEYILSVDVEKKILVLKPGSDFYEEDEN